MESLLEEIKSIQAKIGNTQAKYDNVFGWFEIKTPNIAKEAAYLYALMKEPHNVHVFNFDNDFTTLQSDCDKFRNEKKNMERYYDSYIHSQNIRDVNANVEANAAVDRLIQTRESPMDRYLSLFSQTFTNSVDDGTIDDGMNDSFAQVFQQSQYHIIDDITASNLRKNILNKYYHISQNKNLQFLAQFLYIKLWFIHQIETNHNNIEIDVQKTFAGGITNVGNPNVNIVFTKNPTEQSNLSFLEQDKEKVATQFNVTPIKNRLFVPVIYGELKSFIRSGDSYKQFVVGNMSVKKTKLSLALYFNMLIKKACKRTAVAEFEELSPFGSALNDLTRGVGYAGNYLYNWLPYSYSRPNPSNQSTSTSTSTSTIIPSTSATKTRIDTPPRGRKIGGSRKQQTLKRKQRKTKSRKQKK